MNESLSESDEETRICPHCGSKLAYGVSFCPSCGKQIAGDVHSAGAVKRPLSLTIIAAIWFFIGVIYILNSISVLTAATVWTYLTFALGVLSGGTAFGLWTGKRWSYNCAFIAAVLYIILGTLSVTSSSQTFHVSFNFLPLLWAVVVFYYVRKPDAKKYLGVQ